MTTHEFVWTLFVGVVIGWNAHSIILQIAYRLSIVEYRGSKAAHSKGDA